MLRWTLFSLTLLTPVLALFTVVNWPSLPGWLLALATAELGHFLALVTMALLLAAFLVGSVGPLRWPILGLGMLAMVLLLLPAFRAARLARKLPGQLQNAFGAPAPARAPFSWAHLFVPETSPAGPVAAHVDAGNGLDLDFYSPAAGRGNVAKGAPCVIVIHGGRPGATRWRRSGTGWRRNFPGPRNAMTCEPRWRG
jgi:hypothetical protein